MKTRRVKIIEAWGIRWLTQADILNRSTIARLNQLAQRKQPRLS